MVRRDASIEIRYDAACRFCTRMAKRYARSFEAVTEPLSDEEIEAIESFRVRFYHRDSADEWAFGDAYLQLVCSKHPRMGPFARLGIVRWVVNTGYRLVARSRRCTSTC